MFCNHVKTFIYSCKEHVYLNRYIWNILQPTVFRKNNIKRFCSNLKHFYLDFDGVQRKGDIVTLNEYCKNIL